MDDYVFQWDLSKADINLQKHGVSFDEAKTVFSDSLARLVNDPDSSYGEERFIILGESSLSRLLVVCHCYRGSDNIIRLISARKADKRERKVYEGFKHA
ncbi:BrnT family toxin [Glaciecola sp. 1036]|uniref:BrnT family toxin n=1 Tax=Alteromonadaceae TaxID=72275 RepID=UPI003CFC0A0E